MHEGKRMLLVRLDEMELDIITIRELIDQVPEEDTLSDEALATFEAMRDPLGKIYRSVNAIGHALRVLSYIRAQREAEKN